MINRLQQVFLKFYIIFRNGSFDVSEDVQFGSVHSAENIQVGNEVANFYEIAENPKNSALVANPPVPSNLSQQAPSINPAIQGNVNF